MAMAQTASSLEIVIRASLKGKHLITLKEELKQAQNVFNKDQVESMGRAEIIAYICTLREMNGSPDMCKNIMTNFDPQVAVIRKEEDERTGSKGGSQSEVFQEEGSGAEIFLSKSKTSIHSVTPSSDMTEHPDPWITWQIEAQRIRIEQETARADQERVRREDLERVRLLEEKRLKEKDELEQQSLKDKEIKEEKRHKERIEAEERLRLLEEKRLKEK